jgi:hypothetical protein
MATLGAAVRDGIVAPAPPTHARARARTPSDGGGGAYRMLFISLALSTVAVAGLLQVLQTSHVATAGFELRTLQAERSTLQSEIRLLEAAVADRSQLELIRNEAVERLGMVEPVQTLRVTIDEPAPNGVPLPRRYVDEAPVIESEPAPWWVPFLERIPGFE